METLGIRWRKVTSDDFMFGTKTCALCSVTAVFLREETVGGQRRVTEHRCLDHMDLEALAALAHAAFERLSPEDKKRHRREQAISFAVGNLRLDGIEVTEEQVARALDLNEFQKHIRDTRDAFARLPAEDQRRYLSHVAHYYDDGGLNLPDLP